MIDYCVPPKRRRCSLYMPTPIRFRRFFFQELPFLTGFVAFACDKGEIFGFFAAVATPLGGGSRLGRSLICAAAAGGILAAAVDMPWEDKSKSEVTKWGCRVPVLAEMLKGINDANLRLIGARLTGPDGISVGRTAAALGGGTVAAGATASSFALIN